MRSAILSARSDVNVPVEAARAWFLALDEHPQRYEFDTHDGFAFTHGGFAEEGARFRTREKFLGLRLNLSFQLAEVQETAFRFWLRRPACLKIWGRFEIEESSPSASILWLRVGSESRIGQLLLRCYPVAAAVHGQIHREVRHIRRSMLRVYGGGQTSSQGR